MSMKAGARQEMHHAAVLATPPGELQADELTGSDLIATLDDAFHQLTEKPRLSVPVKDIVIEKIGRWVFLTVHYKGSETNEFTVKISRAWAEVIFGRLARTLGK